MGRAIATILVGAALAVLVSAAGPRTVTVTQADSGRTIRVIQGGMLEVRLESHGGAGYTWEAASVPAKLLTPHGMPSTSDPWLPGGMATQVFRFDTMRTGADYLTFNVSRSWQASIPASKMFSIKVQVVP